MTPRKILLQFSSLLLIMLISSSMIYVHAYAPYRPDGGGPKWRNSDIPFLYIYI